jgi:hypothetical protein
MFLLDWGPVDPNDEVVVFETKPAPSSPEARPEQQIANSGVPAE